MATIKVRATSLAFEPNEPETEWHFTAIGDSKHIEKIDTDAPDHVKIYITISAKKYRYQMQPSFYMPEADTMMNFMTVIEHYWEGYEDKCLIEVDGDIGTIPYKKGVHN